MRVGAERIISERNKNKKMRKGERVSYITWDERRNETLKKKRKRKSRKGMRV